MRVERWFRVWILALLCAVLSGGVLHAAGPVRIGFVLVSSGSLATFGTISKQGAELAIDQVNEIGGIGGRKVVGIFKDSKGDPVAGREAFLQLVKEDKVDVVIGPSLSSVAKAIAPAAEETGTPLIIPVAMTPDVTGSECNRYTFRIGQNLHQNLKSAAILASELNADKWTTIGPDYVYGHQSWEYFQQYLGELKPHVRFLSERETAFAPTETVDWGPYIDTVMATKPDGVLISLFGRNLIDFVKQARRKGFFGQGYEILVNIGASTEVLRTLGSAMPAGIWLGAPYWFDAVEGSANANFTRAYRTRFGAVPSYMAHGGYGAVMTYLEAARACGSTDKDAVITALEGLTLDLPVGTVTIRAEDHQAITPGYWGKTAEISGPHRLRILQPLKIMAGLKITPSVEESGCLRKMAQGKDLKAR